ncbi:hypothetical protein [Piscirickettsia litoralis]|uniref:Uncharacterized protein n=1 Tax=Piscirickettsia litoralis TaxID=1891921 RepID=A0ABX3A2I5_9GAMM|nr:hypothetical protein [Piscirickettsia litoralis]ODN42849.1 hypothetical protein BGC07_07835 [Piscirickettsia litoralis]
MKTCWLIGLVLSLNITVGFALQLPFPPPFTSAAHCSIWLQSRILSPIKKNWFKKLTSNQVQYSANDIKQLSHFSHWFKNAINNSQENYDDGLLTSIQGVCYLFSSKNKADIKLGKKILTKEISAFNTYSASLPDEIPLHCDINKHCSIGSISQSWPLGVSSNSLLPFGT